MPYCRLFYHLIWGTKNRLPLIDPEIEQKLHGAIAAKARKLGGVVHAIGGTEDHIHLVVSVPPKISLSRFIGEVKGASSHFVNHVLNREAFFAWQTEYGAITFAGENLPDLVGYVHRQHQHHAVENLRSAFELVE